MGCTRRLKFDTQTTHRLLAEFRGLRVRMTHVTRRTRTKISYLNPKFFRTQNLFQRQIFFSNPKFYLDPNIQRTTFFSDSNFFFRLNIFFGNFISGPKLFSDPKFFWNQIFDLETFSRDWGTFYLNMLESSLVKT